MTFEFQGSLNVTLDPQDSGRTLWNSFTSGNEMYMHNGTDVNNI